MLESVEGGRGGEGGGGGGGGGVVIAFCVYVCGKGSFCFYMYLDMYTYFNIISYICLFIFAHHFFLGGCLLLLPRQQCKFGQPVDLSGIGGSIYHP